MNARPAGFSDDDCDDCKGFSFPDDHLPDIPVQVSNVTKSTARDLQSSNSHKGNVSQDAHELDFTLMNACIVGQTEVIDEYARLHNVNDFLYTGWTPLLYACASVQPDIVEYLLSLGADPNKHKDGFTPLMALCNSIKGAKEKCLRCLSLLIEAKANVDATGKQRETALMYACKMREPEVIEELLKHVKDIDACDSEEQTALFYAVIANRVEVVQLLLEHKANPAHRDRRNQTIRDIAMSKEFEKILSLLGIEEETFDNYESKKILGWRDMFPSLCAKDEETVNLDISGILYGMGLRQYKKLFCGMDLKTFLQLNEDDLIRLGMDISCHRKRFLEDLQKFHVKKWSVRSIGTIKKSLPYTIYDGVVSLGNVARQINVIGSSFQYIKNGLQRVTGNNAITANEKLDYNENLRKTQETLKILKKEIHQVKTLADKIAKENNLGVPATYISKKNKKYNWTIILSVTLMAGIYLSKTTHIQKLWNE